MTLWDNGFLGQKWNSTCCKRWKYISNAENAGWIEWVNKKEKEQVLNTKELKDLFEKLIRLLVK